MGKSIVLTWNDLWCRAKTVAIQIKQQCPKDISINLFGVGRGGIAAALMVMKKLEEGEIWCSMVSSLPNADFIIDDVLDSGETKEYFETILGDTPIPFLTLVDKQKEEKLTGVYVVFPWEEKEELGPTENVVRLLQFIGEDPTREGLVETPNRVIHSYKKLFGGYSQNPKEFVKIFEDDTCDEMVIVRNIQFYSTCEHHMLPFFGKAHIAYIPKGKIIGVSKLIRILEVYTRRLTIQERIVQQVTEALQDLLGPSGAACVLEGQHFCMTARGVEKQDSIMVTSSLTGSFKTVIETRNEFLKMIRS